MKTRRLEATLKEHVLVSVEIEDVFERFDWLEGASILEQQKRKMLSEIKKRMHEQIATLSMDDIKYTIN